MATAEELLASVEACADILTVDLNTQTIIIPKSVTILGVESDDSVRILHFRVPRHFCRTDLSEFSIRINYENAKGGKDLYEVKNPTITDDTIYFDWLVGRNAVTYKGNVEFSVCMQDLDGEGIVLREFNTTPAVLPVLKGLETARAVTIEHADAFEQLKLDILGSGATLEQEIQDLGEQIKSDLDNAIADYVDSNVDKLKGPKGDPFVYEDFTSDQLEALKGEKGDPFVYEDFTSDQIEALKGEKGDPFVYEDFTSEQLETLKGEKGDPFVYEDFTSEQLETLKGEKGDPFVYENFTSEQLETLKGEKGDPFVYEDFTPEQLEALKGEKGDPFVYEDFSSDQLEALRGEKGDPFVYEDFTPEQLEALKGEKGDPFVYEDFTSDQLEALKGEKGDPFTYDMFTDEQLKSLVGPKGDDGENIVSVERTSGTGAAGTIDIYTVTTNKGKTYTFKVYNGADGEGAGDMLKSIYDPQNRNTDIYDYVDKKIGDIDALLDSVNGV